MERMNRRAIIKGVTATAITLASPAIATAASDTETLASLIARHKAMHDATTIEGRAVDALEASLSQALPMPDELIAPIDIPGASRLKPNSMWTVKELDRYLDSATYFNPTRSELPCGGFTLTCVDSPLPPETRAYMRRVRALRESYDASTVSHYEPYTTRQAAWERSLDTVDAALNAIIEYRATSWATLHEKTDYLRTVEAIAKGTDTGTALAITESLIADILALTATA